MTDDLSDQIDRLDLAGLSQLLRERRGALSLRQAAAESGVSFSTFSRVEAGAQPDLVSFTKLCAWLGLHPSRFFAPIASREEDGVEAVVGHLFADPRLTPENAGKIASMLRDMYTALAEPVKLERTIACHLRAAGVLRPGVSERLSRMLTDMEHELEHLLNSEDL